MREKYIDEITGGPWFVFGTSKDGAVDVSEANRDVFTNVSRDCANRLIEARDKFLAELYEILKDQ
jgi:hypothetical protein